MWPGPPTCPRPPGNTRQTISFQLIIPKGKRKGQNPGLASTYRALAEHPPGSRPACLTERGDSCPEPSNEEVAVPAHEIGKPEGFAAGEVGDG
ncbi:hypothetical protein HEK616_77230 (plasmid) [Streptomyces nigrescens]|uniref:Uncharacterized protein n=1 Tax=Streptomyces nigrescens TaxID=1920 RepID=A0ABM8A6A5_STRNI|nr:hypothetical protein HEK616_77230 [Streptomyces nigrescens]